MPESAPQPLVLYPIPQAVAAARRYVAECLAGLRATAVQECAELGVSELVTNAVLHARTPFTVTVRRSQNGVARVEVTDGSALSPQQRRLSALATTGRGLRLVASLSLDWGVTPLPAGQDQGKTVWFEPLEEMTASGFAEADWAADIEALTQ
ncbi:ATP-binding protein [uncultured Cellulomonas sp.]|uniref:ATP-binding protein n=1 Tax=uncultured Cellulomonas sp. TaxID=189682 RepID=UPI00261E4EBC|nr:ATP-binding protein [uncultured Cellulomonas sp.]